jgi:hypothetical protein
MSTYGKGLSAGLVLGLLFLAGCGGGGDDSSMTLEQLKTEAPNMTVAKLRAGAEGVKAKIEAKTTELTGLQDELKQIKPADLMSDKAKELNTKVAEMTKSVDDLKARLKVYVDALKAKGEDVGDLMMM